MTCSTLVLAIALTLPLQSASLGLKFQEPYPADSPHIGPHLGQDFMAKEGTPIKSIEDGVVLFVGNYLGKPPGDHYETAVEVRSGNRLWSFFHVKPAPGIVNGTGVREGQVIGYVSHCPILAYGDHLHLELKVYLDPLKFLEGTDEKIHPVP